MTSAPLHPQHPVLACTQTIDEALDSALDPVAGSNPLDLSCDQKREALVGLARAKSRITALELSVLAVSGDIAEAEAARDAGPWVAAATRQDQGQVHRRVKLAQALDTRWGHVGAALAAGAVNLEQAEVIVAAWERLTEPLPPDPVSPERGATPRHLPPEVLQEAERSLVAAAGVMTPRELKGVGEKILEMVAPTIAEQDELRRLEREEARSSAATRFSMTKRGDGSTDIKGRIPDAAAARLRTYLQSITAPRHDANTTGKAEKRTPSRFLDSTGKRLPSDRVLGEALVLLLDAMDPDRMPIQAGAATKVIVTIALDQLLAERGMATLGDGTKITAGAARRMACQAGILPAVLDGKSQVLDYGREKRLFTAAQREAMSLTHRQCQEENCTVPATWCEAHHKQPWALGGTTNLKDGALLCPWHHQRIHDTHYRHQYLPNGNIRFTRRR